MDVKFVFPVTKASFWLAKLYFSTKFDPFHNHFSNFGTPAPVKKNRLFEKAYELAVYSSVWSTWTKIVDLEPHVRTYRK